MLAFVQTQFGPHTRVTQQLWPLDIYKPRWPLGPPKIKADGLHEGREGIIRFIDVVGLEFVPLELKTEAAVDWVKTKFSKFPLLSCVDS